METDAGIADNGVARIIVMLGLLRVRNMLISIMLKKEKVLVTSFGKQSELFLRVNRRKLK